MADQEDNKASALLEKKIKEGGQQGHIGSSSSLVSTTLNTLKVFWPDHVIWAS